MDPICNVSYVIKPRAKLHGLLTQFDPHATKHILKPPVYHDEERADSGWSVAERLLNVKLLFLNAIRTREPFRNDEDFAAVFGTSRLSAALFDQWWTVERVEAPMELLSLHAYMVHATEPISPTGSTKVDEWLANLRTPKMERSFLSLVLFHRRYEYQISPLVHVSSGKPVVELLVDAAHRFNNDAFDACAAFVAYCFPGRAYVNVFNLPGIPWTPWSRSDAESDPERTEWYDRVLALVANWDKPAYLFDVEAFLITCRGEVLWPENKRA